MAFGAALLAGAASAAAAPAPERWTAEKAWEWYKKRPWPCGFNYVPSTACNTTEFWAAETFDEPTIGRELGWAQGIGFNTCRVFVQYLVWKNDPEGLKVRIDRFLTLADKHKIATVVVLFDDCAFGDPPQTEPVLGKQREPIPGMIAPSWTPSPGLKEVADKAAWPDLEKYVKDVVGTFGRDKRVLLWDLYNEPGNTGMGSKSLGLLEATFAWARAATPEQPLTTSVWSGMADLNKVMLDQSDVISFHRYTDYGGMKAALAEFNAYKRPVICTEWMARLQGSKIETDLPLFKAEGVGCLMWGLVNGRIQCQFGWASKRGAPEPDVWFHDLFRKDGTPYRPAEIEAIRKCTGRAADPDAEAAAGWRKSEANPVLGGDLGTCFDVSVMKDAGRFRMWFSWRPKVSIALMDSADGIHWGPPEIVLGPNKGTDWEADINRPVVLKRGDLYQMWYTGQARGHSSIGYATSPDGKAWRRMSEKPVLSPDKPWEKVAVMCPHVEWDEAAKRFRMWYSGGEQYEPDALGYATSPDGLAWTKYDKNPIFAADPSREWEQHKVTAAQVVRQGDGYLMFYIGFRDEHRAQIGLARSKDGITGWQRHPANPILRPGKDQWDHDACYKPFALLDGGRWMLWYNGRRGDREQIGLATHEGNDLGF